MTVEQISLFSRVSSLITEIPKGPVWNYAVGNPSTRWHFSGTMKPGTIEAFFLNGYC